MDAPTIGTLLGPCRILAPVAPGGLGEVSRAHGTRLEREVAIKVLPAHLACSGEARVRFEPRGDSGGWTLFLASVPRRSRSSSGSEAFP